ncbi:methyltransferase domain-containing protein, partial [Streptomyces niveus]
MSTAAELRTVLADRLTEDGTLREPGWSAAARAVPRELFTGAYFLPVAGSFPTAYRPVREGEPGWLEGVYTDETLITQLDGRTRPDDVTRRTVPGNPSSSSTLPSLVLRMWHQLGAEAGHRVLEIGTGTGYSTALGAHRLGDADLTSVEYDPVVGRAAAAALKAAGFAPRLIIGDGLRGDPDGGQYDRLIATCSVRYIPLPWLHQVRPGGKILVTLSGWSYANALALLEVTGPGEATGRFLPGHTSFMIARPHDRPPRPTLVLLPGEERPSRIDPAKLDDWT